MTNWLRAAAFALWFYGVTFAFCFAGLGVRLVAPARALDFAKAWVRAVFAGMGPICGIRLVVTGQEHLPSHGPALIASQHQSEFDTLVWMILVPQTTYVMKQELTRIPLFGPLLTLAGMIPVDRAAGASALRKLLQETAGAIRTGRQIVIFPEGTRVPPGQRVALQPGFAAIAVRLGLPVHPVATDSGRCWARDPFRRRSGTIHVAIGPAIPAGTPRAALLAQVEGFWRRMENDAFAPVDKLVEQTRRLAAPLPQETVNTLANHDS